jgi:hypothetical protein
VAEFFADENFRLEVVEGLRGHGHDVLTAGEAGLANQAVSDTAILEHATGEGRAVLTLNRWDFVRLHRDHPEHTGIVACTADPDSTGQAARIDAAVRSRGSLKGVLLRIDRPS